MNLVRLALGRPLTVVVLVIAVVLGAGLALRRMVRDISPPLGIPTIYVAQPYGGMDPAQMEGYLTYYYEYHFLYITGIEPLKERLRQRFTEELPDMSFSFEPSDIVSRVMSLGAIERQTILETVPIEDRLKRLIRYLMAEIQEYREPGGS